MDVSALGEDLDNLEDLERSVHRELIQIRGERGLLNIRKFGGHHALVRVCGGGDLLDAFLMFERELKRYESAERDVAAAAISINAPAGAVLDRLEYVVAAFADGHTLRDQRTARRWSDAGLRVMAHDLVYFAKLQGRLGRELLSVELHGNGKPYLSLIVEQMTSRALGASTPLVRVWHYLDGEPIEEMVSLDLDEVDARTASRDRYLLHRHRLMVEIPSFEIDQAAGEPLVGISIEGRDAPMRTVAIEDQSRLSERLGIRFSVYRTIALIEVIGRKKSP